MRLNFSDLRQEGFGAIRYSTSISAKEGTGGK